VKCLLRYKNIIKTRHVSVYLRPSSGVYCLLLYTVTTADYVSYMGVWRCIVFLLLRVVLARADVS